MSKNAIHIRRAEPDDMDWVNARYREIDFLPSAYEKEYIAIASLQSTPCGLGRLVRLDEHNYELGGMYVLEAFRKQGIADAIVRHLLDQQPQDDDVTLWCIPFKHLEGFYGKFGFQPIPRVETALPTELATKYEWCDNTFTDRQVTLMVMSS